VDPTCHPLAVSGKECKAEADIEQFEGQRIQGNLRSQWQLVKETWLKKCAAQVRYDNDDSNTVMIMIVPLQFGWFHFVQFG